MGMLHDIGRYHGPSDLMHIVDGYHLLMEHGDTNRRRRFALRIRFPHMYFGGVQRS